MRQAIFGYIKKGPKSTKRQLHDLETRESTTNCNEINTTIDTNDQHQGLHDVTRHSAITKGENLGLKVLYMPEDLKDSIVDIVFVHGLTGNAFKTWHHEEKGVHWPSTLLKESVPNARIFTFGYDANVTSFWCGASHNRLSAHAQNLVGDLTGEREDTNTEDQKIIFIAHSLGGLVVERALQLSENNAEAHLRKVEASTIGIVFLATPHYGSDFAPFAKAVGKSLRLVGKRVNTDILDTLKSDSQVLLDVEDWFGHWRRRRAASQNAIQISCFSEELELPAVGKVVDDQSARLAGYSCYSIHANHMDIGKFSDINDPGYKAVSREIRRWAKAIHNQREAPPEDAAREQRINQFLAALYTCPYQDRKDINDEPVPGTCEWFTGHELFKTWNESKSSGLLWVSADPGSGKSVLAKHIVDRVLPCSGRTVCYFFFKDGFTDQQSGSNALCSIIRQLLLQNPHLLRDDILLQSERDGASFRESIKCMWKVLTELCTRDNSGEIVCVIDGLDECRRDDLPRLSSEIQSWFWKRDSTKLKILLTSRPYQHIRWGFQALKDHMPTIHLSGEDEVEVEKITKEIDLVIQSRVRSIAAKRKLSEEERTHLQHHLTAIPNRTYLWVSLTLDIIERMHGFTRGNVIKAVKQLPKTVDEAYTNILNKSPDTGKALKILHCVLGMETPPSVVELSIMMTIEEHHKTQEDLEADLEPADRFRFTLRDLCGLILVVIDGRVYFLHQTAREFLIFNATLEITIGLAESRLGRVWKHGLRLKRSKRIVAQALMLYLSLDPVEFEKVEAKYATQDLTSYAVAFWPRYFSSSDARSNEPITTLALKMLAPTSYWLKKYTQLPYDGIRADSNSSLLIKASYFGLHMVVKLLLDSTDVDADCIDTGGRSPLMWVVIRSHIETVEVLMDYVSSESINRESSVQTMPLHYALVTGSMAIAQLLLTKKGIDVNQRCGRNGHTALHQVVAGAYMGKTKTLKFELLKMLLQVENVDLNAKNDRGDTALMIAARRRREYLMCELLKTGKVDVNTFNLFGETALIISSGNGYESAVRLLLHTGKADVNAKMLRNAGDVHEQTSEILQRRNGDTALIRAVKRGYEECVKLLLQKKANVNETNGHGKTALEYAAENSDFGILLLLLETKQVDTKVIETALSSVREKIHVHNSTSQFQHETPKKGCKEAMFERAVEMNTVLYGQTVRILSGYLGWLAAKTQLSMYMQESICLNGTTRDQTTEETNIRLGESVQEWY